MFSHLNASQETGGNLAALYAMMSGGKFNAAYYMLLKASKVFGLSAAAINPTAFTGGAAGTPIFGLYNPSYSGVDLVLLSLTAAYRNTGSGAVSGSVNSWLANQSGVAVTGTQTQARNLYSGATTGASAYCMVNTANTAAVASNLIRCHLGIQATSTPAQLVQTLSDDIKGAIVVPSGSYLAIGQSAAMTSGSADFALAWAELPA